jgi:tetratricopeptide (TPR) repeat protein
MLDCQFYKLNPAGHHLTNVILHIANTLLLFLVLNRMTGCLWRSAFVAALFALHPLHVESVAWVSERKDVLSTFFWILTIWLYIRYVQRPRFTTYLPIMFSLALGLMAKQMLVTLPFALLLLDYWPLERFALFSPKSTDHKGRFGAASLSRCFLEKLPLLALSAVASAIVFLVQSEATLVKSIPLKYRIGNALVAYAEYIRKMFLPYDLGILYPHPETNLLLWKVFAAASLLACISILIILSFRKRRWLAVGWLWYLGTLVPVIGLIQVGLQAMADRYTYVPLIGLFIIISWAAWTDSITLYKHTVAVTANNDILHYNLGVLLVKEKRFDEAVRHWTEAVRIRPDQHTIQKALEKLLARLDTAKKLFNRGNVLAAQGEIDEAISCYTKSLQFRPGHAPAHNNLANALFLKGKPEQALAHYSKAVEYNPNLVDAHYNMATLFARQKRTDDAIRKYRRVLEIDPNHAGARQALEDLLDNAADK